MLKFRSIRQADRSQSLKQANGAIRHAKGAMGYHAGLSAEDTVIRHYEALQAVLLHHRWRGVSGEIDLIFEQGSDVVFVEVKSSKTHAQAAQALSRRQLGRISRSIEEFLGTQPQGSLTPMRFEVALVDGQGRLEIVENALMNA